MKRLLLSCLLIGGGFNPSYTYAFQIFKKAPKENTAVNFFATVNKNGSLKKGASPKALVSRYKKLPVVLRTKTLPSVVDLARDYLELLLRDSQNSKLKATLEKGLGARGREEVENNLISLLYAFGEYKAGRVSLFDRNPPPRDGLSDKSLIKLYTIIEGIHGTLSSSKNSKTRKRAEVDQNPVQLVDDNFIPKRTVRVEDFQKKFPRIEDDELVALPILLSLLRYRENLAKLIERTKNSALKTKLLKRRESIALALGAKPDDFGLWVFALAYYQAQRLRETDSRSSELKSLPSIHSILLERDVTLQSKGH